MSIRFSLVGCLIFIAQITWAADGTFMVVKGDIKVAAKGKAKVPARVGMKVGQADKVFAGKDSRAKIVMSDKNIINISPDTELVIEAYKTDAAKDERNVSLNVIYGKVRATVNQKYDGDKNKFQVKTPSAVAGVRGTDFMTSYNQSTNASKVVTFEGSVTMGSGLDSSGKIQNPVSVPAGSFSVASNAAPPAPAAPVPPKDLQAMNRESNADGTAGRPDSTSRTPAGDDKGGKSDKSDKSEKSDKTEKSEKSDKGQDKSSDKGSDKNADKKSDAGEKAGDKGGDKNADKGADKSGPRNADRGPEKSQDKGPDKSASNTGSANGGTARGPAAISPDSGSKPPAPGATGPMPPPTMISNMGTEIHESAPVIPNLPDLPPIMTGDIYKPPEVPTDLIQQNTNLSVRVNVQ